MQYLNHIFLTNTTSVNQWKAVYGCIPKREADFVRKAIAVQHNVDKEMWNRSR